MVLVLANQFNPPLAIAISFLFIPEGFSGTGVGRCSI